MKVQQSLPVPFSFGSYTRRQMITGGVLAVGGLALTSARVAAQQSQAGTQPSQTILMAKAIHHEVDISSAPQRIYEALLDAKQFSAFSGFAGAEIHREVGGSFTLFGGHVTGRNLELAANRLIVQAWRAGDWSEGVYSIARFELVSQGAGARIKFDHTGFPVDKAEHLEDGWREHYWTTLQKYLA